MKIYLDSTVLVAAVTDIEPFHEDVEHRTSNI